MSKSDTFENDLMKMIFNQINISGVTDNLGGSPNDSLYVSLHTADPGETGTQSTSEIAYTGYARVAVVRSAGAWTVTNNSVSPVSAISFGAMSGGAGGTVTHFGIGTASSGTGKLLYSGTVTPNITVNNGVTPQLTTATAVTED